jgi:hypothetical protein
MPGLRRAQLRRLSPANVTLAPKGALARRQAGESPSDIARTYGVAHPTTMRP